MERRMIISTGEYGLWKLNLLMDNSINKANTFQRLKGETHFKKIRPFIINIDKKEGLYKIIVDFRKNIIYTLKKGTTTICVGNNLNIVHNCK